jgi:polar amino acid transport system permease protein
MARPPGAPEPPGPLPDGGDGRSMILSGFRREGAKSVLIAITSTVVLFTLLVIVVVNSPNWVAVKDLFFNVEEFRSTFPNIARKFLVNVQLFLIGEAFILVVALVVAVVRSLPGPVFFPVRALAIAYADLFRGMPTIMVVYLFGLGIPGLQIPGVPTSAVFWGMLALILSYSAYVSEVYRAGIESVHVSQVMSARSLGLSRWQSLRFVVLPQAIRRVIPPLLNDFVSLQKDTALIAFVAVTGEAFRQAQIDSAADFNYTPILAAALLFVAVTIPLTRLVDWLVGKERAQREGGLLR